MRSIFLSLLAVTIFAAPVMAQPLADKVAANPIFYFGWRGSDDLGPAYADSHLKAILDQSNIPEVFTDMMPRAVARVQRESPEAGQALRSALNISGTMWHHPTAIFLADIDLSGENPMPKAAVLCQAGDDSTSLLAQLDALVKLSGKCPVPMRAYQSAGIVVFSIGYAEDQDVVALASSKSLKAESTFASAMKQVQADPLLTLYVNFERGVSLIDDAIDQKGPPEAKEYWPKIRDASGIAGLKRLVATAAFDGKDWMEAAYLEAPTPHAGLIAALDNGPLDESQFKLAPADSDMVMAGTFNIAKFVAALRAGVVQVHPEAGAMVDKVFGAISLYVGRDFQKEVLEPIGDQWLAFSSPTIGGRGLLGGVIVNKLDDPKKAVQGIMATQIAIFNTAAAFLAQHNITIRCQNFHSGDLSINYLAIPLVSPAWCVSGENLYIALYPQNIITAVHFAKSDGKSIVDNENFASLRKRLGAPDKITGIRYQDLTQTVGEGYQGVLAMSRLLLGVGDIFGVKSPEPVIPPLDVLIKQVGPSGAVSWSDDTGWHSRAISSFPGAEVLGGGGNNAVIGMVTQMLPAMATVLPALGKARAQAMQVQDMSNLRQIGLGCIMYANDHKGVLPQTLDEILPYVGNSAKIFVSPAHAAQVAAVAGLPPEALAEWVRRQTDYEYVGNGQKLSKIQAPATAPLAYTRDATEDGKHSVLFADGHVEMMQQAQFQGVLSR